MLHNLPTPPTDLTETLTPRLQQDLQDILAYLDRTLDPATPEHSRLLAKPEDAIRRISEALYNTLTDAATT